MKKYKIEFKPSLSNYVTVKKIFITYLFAARLTHNLCRSDTVPLARGVERKGNLCFSKNSLISFSALEYAAPEINIRYTLTYRYKIHTTCLSGKFHLVKANKKTITLICIIHKY